MMRTHKRVKNRLVKKEKEAIITSPRPHPDVMVIVTDRNVMSVMERRRRTVNGVVDLIKAQDILRDVIVKRKRVVLWVMIWMLICRFGIA
jgi:hypothetical protein